MEQKKILRDKFLKFRKRQQINEVYLKSEDIVKKTQAVIDSILYSKKNLPNFDKKIDFVDSNSYIGLYWPMDGEVDLTKLAIKFSSRVSLPKIKGTKMYYVKYNHNSLMEKSSFSKLMQPKNENKVEPCIVIIPALSISLDGKRLGFGAGYYDKYINDRIFTKSPIKIGVCFHEVLIEYLPSQPHDLKLDYVITEKIIIEL